jgi:hypothetical protein
MPLVPNIPNIPKIREKEGRKALGRKPEKQSDRQQQQHFPTQLAVSFEDQAPHPSDPERASPSFPSLGVCKAALADQLVAPPV